MNLSSFGLSFRIKRKKNKIIDEKSVKKTNSKSEKSSDNRLVNNSDDISDDIIEDSSKEELNNLFLSKRHIIFRSIIAILSGSILILLGIVVNVFGFSFEHKELNLLLNTVTDFFKTTGGIVIAMGVSTICLDFFSYVDYAKNVLKKIVVSKDFLNQISANEKNKMINKLESSLYYPDGCEDKESLFYNIKNGVIPYIGKCYFKKYCLHIECNIRDSYIERMIKRDLEVYCPKNDYSFKLPMSTSLKTVNGFDTKDLMSIVQCRYLKNKDEYEDITKRVNKSLKIVKKEVWGEVLNTFEYEYIFNLTEGINKIEIKSKTISPIDDSSYGHRLTIPCKNYDVFYTITNSEEYEIIGRGFALNSKGNVKVRYFHNTCRLTFDDWMLPGEGSVFVTERKINMN